MSSLPAAPTPRLTSRERWILVSILVGALVIRLAVMWFPNDQMFENGQLPFEELQRGNATLDLMDGTLLPLLDYAANHFSGGSLFVSILAMPLFYVFGPAFNVLRLVSLFFGLPLVLLTFLLVRRKYSLRAAVVASALVAFGPPGLHLISCTVYGAHPEATLLNVLIVWLWFSWNDAGRDGRWRSFALGLAIGFSLWFSYGVIVIVVLLMLLNFAATRLRPIRSGDLFLGAGFLVGFSPWIAYVATHPGSSFVIYDDSIADHLHAGLVKTRTFAKMGRLLFEDAPASLWFHGASESGGLMAARFFLYAILGVILWCAWTARGEFVRFASALLRRRTDFVPTLRLVALLFVGSWFSAYVLTDFRVGWRDWVQGYRYLVPFWPFMCILVGIAVHDLAVRGRTLIPTIAVVATCTVFTSLTVVQLRPDRFAEQWSAPASKPTWHLRMLVLRFGWDEKTMRHVLERALETRTPEEQKTLVDTLARGISRFATERPTDPKWIKRQALYRRTLDALCSSGPEPYRATFERERAAALRLTDAR